MLNKANAGQLNILIALDRTSWHITGMDCPFCGADTKVTRTTTPEQDQRLIIRERQCIAVNLHRFSTEEHERLAMVDVAVHQKGSGALVPYSRLVLGETLRDSLFISASANNAVFVADLLERVEQRITRRSIHLRRLTENERERLAVRSERLGTTDPAGAGALRAIRVVVNDGDIEAAVDAELSQSQKTRSHRVLYALAVQGRQGSARIHPGWKDADDALEWLLTAFPHLTDQELPERVTTTPVEVAIPTVRETPKYVLKRDGIRSDFDIGRFKRAVGKALRGRRDEDTKADGVTWGTLARLQGQVVVHSSQLSVIALELLRATDEIAYLRAAVRIKGFNSVTDIFNDAMGLLTHPSQRHVFSEPMAQAIVPRTLG